jgi:hypothetical protein
MNMIDRNTKECHVHVDRIAKECAICTLRVPDAQAHGSGLQRLRLLGFLQPEFFLV